MQIVTKHANKKNIFTRARERACSVIFIASILLGLVYSTGLIVGPSWASGKGTRAPLSVEDQLNSSDRDIRLQGAEKLRTHPGTLSNAKISQLKTQEKDPLIRHRLNQALARSGLSTVVVDLLNSLKSDSDIVVRQGAAQELGNYTNNLDVVKELAQSAKKETDSSVRTACLLSLSVSQSEEATKSLEKFLNDNDPQIRRVVAVGLKRQNTISSKKLLKKLQSDPDEDVRAAAGVLP